MKKRCQVTLFIIIGIVILVIVGLLIYLTTYVTKKGIEKEITKSENIPLAVQPIKTYIETCLDKTAKDAIILIGKQGGYIYENFGGLGLPPLLNGAFVDYDNNIYSYIIYPPMTEDFPFSSKPPNYPWINFPIDPYPPYREEVFAGDFGLLTLPPLEGLGQMSIQYQLMTYIKNKIKDCMEFNVFEEQGFAVEEKGKLTVDVAIATTDIAVHLNYPLEIKSLTTEETTEISDFYINPKVRLRGIYGFVKELVSNDKNKINFDISDRENYRDDMTTQIRRGDGTDNKNYNDIITIIDNKLLLKDKPYEFNFARRNRRPALYFIKPINPATNMFHENDWIYESNITKNPQAIDPDEDENLVFKFDPEGTADSLPTQITSFYELLCNQNGKIIIKTSVEDDEGLEDYQNIEVPCS